MGTADAGAMKQQEMVYVLVPRRRSCLQKSRTAVVTCMVGQDAKMFDNLLSSFVCVLKV